MESLHFVIVNSFIISYLLVNQISVKHSGALVNKIETDTSKGQRQHQLIFDFPRSLCKS